MKNLIKITLVLGGSLLLSNLASASAHGGGGGGGNGGEGRSRPITRALSAKAKAQIKSLNESFARAVFAGNLQKVQEILGSKRYGRFVDVNLIVEHKGRKTTLLSWAMSLSSWRTNEVYENICLELLKTGRVDLDKSDKLDVLDGILIHAMDSGFDEVFNKILDMIPYGSAILEGPKPDKFPIHYAIFNSKHQIQALLEKGVSLESLEVIPFDWCDNLDDFQQEAPMTPLQHAIYEFGSEEEEKVLLIKAEILRRDLKNKLVLSAMNGSK